MEAYFYFLTYTLLQVIEEALNFMFACFTDTKVLENVSQYARVK